MSETLYLKANTQDIADYVIFSGDPRRVEKIVGKLENARQIAVAREFHTYTGNYQGMGVTISSTGIGGPSAAIAVEEMAVCGMKVAIRLGTTMGLRSDMLGRLVIPVGAMGMDGTRQTYVENGYPAIADFELLNCMNQSAEAHKLAYENGVVCSCDGYYSQMKESKLSRKLGLDVSGKIDELKKKNICGIDMESSTVLTLCRLLEVKACVVTLTTVLENLTAQMDADFRRQAEENDLIQVVLDGILRYHERVGAK